MSGIYYAEIARLNIEGQACLDDILSQRYNNFDQYLKVNDIADLEIAKVVIKRLLDKVKDLEQDIADMEALANKSNVDSIISDAVGKAQQLVSDTEVCKVTFRRTVGVGGSKFDVYLNIIPEEYRNGKDDFSLTVDERLQAYNIGTNVVGEENIDCYVIGSAEMVKASSLGKNEPVFELQ